MTTENDRSHVIQRGNNAKNLLESPAFVEAYEDLIETFFVQFLATESHEGAERDKIWDLTAALQLLKGKLEVYVGEAKVEAENQRHDK